MKKGQRSRIRHTNGAGKQPQQEGRDGIVSVLFFSDCHFPFQDTNGVERLLDHVKSEQFDYIIDGGDSIDAYSVSKYDPDPARLLQLQSEIDERHDKLLVPINAAQPDAVKRWIAGNHEMRLPSYIRRKAPALECLRGLAMPTLMRNAEAGWESYGPEGFVLGETRYKHGEKVAKGAGNSVLKEMEHHWRGVIMGHCHRQAVRRIRKDDREFVGAESGGLMSLNPEYVNFPDWQGGWLTINHHPDGSVEITEHGV